MKSLAEIRRLVAAWIEIEIEDKYLKELDDLTLRLAAEDSDAIEQATEMFGARVSFGTAGLRGPMRAGPNGLNRTVIAQTTAGLAQFLAEREKEVGRQKSVVVVGFDGRHNSETFARDTSEILAGSGFHVMLMSDLVPTPVLAFAVRALEADAGIMITASHNPSSDNGYKLYLGGKDQGSQIVPPAEGQIERHIRAVVEDSSWTKVNRSSESIELLNDDIISSYITKSCEELRPVPPTGREIAVVYSAMHGVGGKTFLTAVQQAGFQKPLIVEDQFNPDPNFSTVSFPNPEEKGALDMSIDLARENSADLIIAHDPDADRLAVGVRSPAEPGGYRILSGNETGAILGWHLAESLAMQHAGGSFANSIVSSPILQKICNHFGIRHEETLTGFKHVSRVSNLKFGYEEALGFLVTPDSVRDKDGITAALAIISLVNVLAKKGETLIDYLQNIYSTVGAFSSRQITKSLNPGFKGAAITNAVREKNIDHIGSFSVTRMDDFQTGEYGFPPTDILRFYLDNNCRVIIRPSGTEPKVKFYIDTQEETIAAATRIAADLESALGQIVEELSEPE